MSRQRSSRVERRAEREAREPGSEPRARRQRQRGGGSGSKQSFLSRLNRLNKVAIAVGLGAIVVAGILVYAITQTGGTAQASWQKAQMDDDPSLPGTYYPPHPGPDGVLGTADDRLHYPTGTVIPICTDEQLASGNVSDPLCYTSNPPTSGPHADRPMQFTALTSPAPKENLVHDMEHGGTVIWYNTTDQDVIDKIQKITKDLDSRGKEVVSSFYGDMEPDTIAITAWTRMEKFPVSEYSDQKVKDWVSVYDRRFNPEGF